MDLVFIVAVVAFIVMLTCMCCRSKRPRPLFSAPVLVTTTEYVQPAPGINGAHTIVNTVPVMASAQAMGHTGRGMVQHTHYQERNNQYEGHLPTGGASYPMPTGGVSYPMPQPQNLQGIPMPPGQQQTAGAYPIPWRQDNPPSYDQVAVSDAYQKQQPYNPNFQP